MKMSIPAVVVMFFYVCAAPGAPIDPLAPVPSAPPAVNPYDWFKTGETVESLRLFTYYRAISDSLRSSLAEHRTLFAKVGVAAITLKAFDDAVALAVSLPFDKSYDQWGSEGKERWAKECIPAIDMFVHAVKDDAAKTTDAHFFYWLGLESLKADFQIPEDVNDSGTSLKDEMRVITGMLSDFQWLKDEKLFESLTPEVQSAVTSLANQKIKPMNPLTGEIGVSTDDIGKMQKLSQIIRQAARDKNLVR